MRVSIEVHSKLPFQWIQLEKEGNDESTKVRRHFTGEIWRKRDYNDRSLTRSLHGAEYYLKS
jgi:hypothetical protein